METARKISSSTPKKIRVPSTRGIAKPIARAGTRSAVGEPVRRFRRLALHQELVRPPLRLAAGDAHALVLAQVLKPGLAHEGLEEARRFRQVFEQLPEERAVAPAHLA